MCKYKENDRVQYTLDTDENHWYIVRDATPTTSVTAPCVYYIVMENDPGVRMANISESYLTDADEDGSTTEASASK